VNELPSVTPISDGADTIAGDGFGGASCSVISVQCKVSERQIVSEFFELFKTPWRFWQAGEPSSVVLSSTGEGPWAGAKLVLIFSSSSTPADAPHTIVPAAAGSHTSLRCGEDLLPIFGSAAQVRDFVSVIATIEPSSEPMIGACCNEGSVVIRAGYDLFGEIEHCLGEGQPLEAARSPTVDLHISLLRDLILNSSHPLVEIPPVPDGYTFAVCLTHDVDHPSIRQHQLDHTTAGFLYRASFGSLGKFVKRRLSLQDLLTNLVAVAKLPLVHLRLARDYWLGFDRYAEIEQGLGSTFYFIPYRGRPGRGIGDSRPQRLRASQYGVADIPQQVTTLRQSGCEIGLHGIDAWSDPALARDEASKVEEVAGTSVEGVRMHWLYFDRQSIAKLDSSRFSYDSTVGYNETVGFKSGTFQPYRPPESRHLLELPLHVMDTALFYPSYLNLCERQARLVVNAIAAQALRFGGVLTINWHDRSISPERMWEAFYVSLISSLKFKGPWFPTAANAVKWFRVRRSAEFRVKGDGAKANELEIRLGHQDGSLPGLRLRLHHARSSIPLQGVPLKRSGPYTERSFHQSVTVRLGA